MDYVAANKSLWNEKTKHHVGSAFYDTAGFKAGKNMLNSIELDALGDVSGKSLLHLQCHFGIDTLCFARLGAQVTGIDLSDEAIRQAGILKNEVGLEADFICSDVYDLKSHLHKQFDIVFTSYGTIGWLPDLDKWAEIIAHFLKPGGTFLIADFHPVVWMFDDDFSKVTYAYHNESVIVEETVGTYADRSAPVRQQSYSWNHSLSEIFTALISKGLNIEQFSEYNYSPYNCFKNLVEINKDKYQVQGLDGKLPMVYLLKASKRS